MVHHQSHLSLRILPHHERQRLRGDVTSAGLALMMLLIAVQQTSNIAVAVVAATVRATITEHDEPELLNGM
jgi:hypothetical protein